MHQLITDCMHYVVKISQSLLGRNFYARLQGELWLTLQLPLTAFALVYCPACYMRCTVLPRLFSLAVFDAQGQICKLHSHSQDGMLLLAGLKNGFSLGVGGVPS